MQETPVYENPGGNCAKHDKEGNDDIFLYVVEQIGKAIQ
jgi:hypothetical protein